MNYYKGLVEQNDILLIIIVVNIIIVSIAVICVKNPIHSLLNLVVVFFQTTLLLILLRVETLGLIFLIVYIGAISILFLFVIMMVNIKTIELKEKWIRYLPMAIMLIITLLIEFLLLININKDWIYKAVKEKNLLNTINNISNIESLGLVMYTYNIIYIFIASLVLMVAMIGAIILTLKNSNKSINKDIKAIEQIYNDIKTVEIVEMDFRKDKDIEEYWDELEELEKKQMTKEYWEELEKNHLERKEKEYWENLKKKY